MKAILTRKGARRLRLTRLADKQVDIANVREMPWGGKNATVILDGKVWARSVSMYTPGRGKDCALIPVK